MPIGVVAKLSVQPGKGGEIERVFRELAQQVRANEPGNNFYALHRSRTDENQYVVLEQYADQAALDAHSASAYVRGYAPQLGAFLAAAPEIEYFDAV